MERAVKPGTEWREGGHVEQEGYNQCHRLAALYWRSVLMWRNSEQGYGAVQILIHWTTAILVTGMFALGLTMVDLSYYDPWYHRAPALHKSIGLVLMGLFLFRVLWRLGERKPAPLSAHPWQQKAAGGMHLLLYLALFALLTSGYLIASADGRPIPVFDFFALPALALPVENQEEFAGDVHEVTAWSLIFLVVLHGAAAMKHHFIDKDASLRRILWPRRDFGETHVLEDS